VQTVEPTRGGDAYARRGLHFAHVADHSHAEPLPAVRLGALAELRANGISAVRPPLTA
jgi:hypothetical protein